MLKALHLLQLTSRQGWLVFLFTAYLEFEGGSKQKVTR